ncbi:hypothetical protein BV25DRAFT_1871690 [Artomyces pyxidatus]|uniref:Uncharacterized protein n=1 Tax=Artomyces pyxidatus TaxID=48021 RepID=A0ACB8SS35_9AGAM|nr:hypothetical protein BV25DRAFT_1871690 [Artomyces pyxidatus]
MPRKPHNPLRLPCPHVGCGRMFSNKSGLTQHVRSGHRTPTRLRLPSPVADNFVDADVDNGPAAGLDEDEDMEDIDLGQQPLAPDYQGRCHREQHPTINGAPCDSEGNYLPPNTDPPPRHPLPPTDWTPFNNRVEFETADFLFKTVQMSQKNVTFLMDLIAAMLLQYGGTPPFSSSKDMLSVLDSIPLGDTAWSSFTMSYTGERPEGDVPSWMLAEYEVWYRNPSDVLANCLDNPSFKDEMTYSPYREYGSDGRRRLKDLNSGNWSWRQADLIAEDPNTHGAAFMPIVLGSDKTTVSVATGQTDFYPLYLSPGGLTGAARRAHCDSVIPIAFLAMPKGERKYDNDPQFRQFRRQMFQASLTAILQPVKPYFTTPHILRCPDGHFRRVIFGLGPYIADYPEQALLACIVQGWCPICTAPSRNLERGGDGCRSRHHTETAIEALGDLGVLWDAYGIVSDAVPFTNDFPRADIHELIAPDLLHQLIKGTFKDHLVDWVCEYLLIEHGEARANEIIDDIDRRIAAAPLFPCLRRFKQGRRYKQWTGDDSKALMKVFLSAISGHVPPDVVKCISAFLDFCYIARRSVHTEDSLDALDHALTRFHRHRIIFETTGVRLNGAGSLPRQHSMNHYRSRMEDFAAANGLCSSITEAKHIKAVKEPWRRSNQNEPLGQILLTNQRLDKLAAARADFGARGMLKAMVTAAAAAAVEEAEAEAAEVAAAAAAAAEEIEEIEEIEVDVEVAAELAVEEDEPGEDAEVIDREQAVIAEDDDGGPFDGPTVLGSIELAVKPQPGYPRDVHALAEFIGEPRLPAQIRRFLYEQENPDAEANTNIPGDFAGFNGRVHVYHSAVAIYHAPSDPSGIGGMRKERVRSTPSWRSQGPRRDCVFTETDVGLPGMRGLSVLRVLLFFSLRAVDVDGIPVTTPCALVEWFSLHGDEPDDDTGMWVVTPDLDANGERDVSVVHLDCILRGAHLLPVFGNDFLPVDFDHRHSLDAFQAFYVNKYADHHSHEIAF